MPRLGPKSRLVLLETAGAAAAVLTLTTWFGGWPRGVAPGLAFVALVGLAAGRLVAQRTSRFRLPHVETLVCLGLAGAYRIPALLHPWGWVNRDGAYGAFVALHLLEGDRPAPVFTEGANYQGTLKAHIAALLGLVTRAEDLSLLMVVSSTILYLVFVTATMALARRLGGRAAALVAGLYLALSPRFLTVFSLNCTGQYVEILALGMLALALVARVLDEWPEGLDGRSALYGAGLCCGAALWQQPAALPFAVVALGVLALRGPSWRSASSLYALAGLSTGLVPPLVWNLQNGWATSNQVATNPVHLVDRVPMVPELASKTVLLAFPLLGGLANSDLQRRPMLSLVVGLVFPALFVAYLAAESGRIRGEARRFRPAASLLAPLLFVATILVVWGYASGSAYSRPRYLLPVAGAFAVFVGVVVARALRERGAVAAAAVAGFTCLLGLNVAGSLPRLERSALVASSFEPLLRSLEEKGVRTGYADFSLSAPVTMFTRERITFSASLGPTPAYYSPRHERRVREAGPDAYVLLPTQDVEAFHQTLRALGVTYRFDPEPYPTFFAFSRRVRLEEVGGGRDAAADAGGDE